MPHHASLSGHRQKDLPRIFGRERERELLDRYLDEMLAGHGGLVLIGGEAGIGKTALIESLVRNANQQGALTLGGSCYDLSSTPPYGPWREIARSSPLNEPLPNMLYDTDEHQSTGDRTIVFDQVLEYFAALARQQPLVVVLEDLHWADPASLDMLRFVARQLAEQSILILASYRDDELRPNHHLSRLLPVLVREARARRINLQGLSRVAIQQWIAYCYQLAEPEETRIVGYLARLCSGNPFFIGEMTRSLEDERILRLDDTGWQLGRLRQIQVPPLVRQVTEERLARLDAGTREMLDVAALIGQEISLPLWQAVTESDAPSLLEAAQSAVESHILEGSGDATRFRFVHALVREALYAGVPLPDRRRWHRRVGETLTARRDLDPDSVAHHFKQAGDERAIEWLIRAGERAQHTAWPTAAERFEAALPLMESHGVDAGERGWLLLRIAQLHGFANPELSVSYLDEVAHLASQANDAVLATCALFQRGERHFTMGEFSRGIALIESGLAMIDGMPSDDRARFEERIAGGLWPDESPPLAVLVGRLASLGRFTDARALADRITTKCHDGSQVAHSGASYYSGLAKIHAAAGQPDRARAAFARARDSFRAMHNHTLAGSTAIWELLCVVLPYYSDDLQARERVVVEGEEDWNHAGGIRSGWKPAMVRFPILVVEGEWEAALNLAEESRAMRQTSYRHEITLMILALLAQRQGQTERAWTFIKEALPRGPGTVPGGTEFFTTLAFQRIAAGLAIDEGDLDKARQWLDAHDHWLAWSNCAPGRAEAKVLRARYHDAAGNQGQARQCGEDGLQIASNPRQPLALIAALRLLGEFDTSDGHYKRAARRLAGALELAEVCAARYELALTQLALAGLQIATGNISEARRTLDAVIAFCRPRRAQPLLDRAGALLAQLDARDSSNGDLPDLSPRESEVLELVAEGMTNAAAAEQLSISPRTVEQHLRSIYNKLGSSSRAAAVRFWIENQSG